MTMPTHRFSPFRLFTSGETQWQAAIARTGVAFAPFVFAGCTDRQLAVI